ncbi:hypothetical protein SRABI106_04714 [Rahnella aquatilis]|nr:hypothetical protein SRABI106_04714 [Rahnella aquatilis]
MEGVGADDVVTIFFGIFTVYIIKQMARTLAVQRQLFAPLDHFLIIGLQFVFRITHFRQMTVNMRHQFETAENSDQQPDDRHQQHFR